MSNPTGIESTVRAGGEARTRGRRPVAWKLALWGAALAFLLGAPAAEAAQLQPETIAAFERQAAAADERLRERSGPGERFLWAAEAPERLERLRAGEIVVAPRDGKGDIAVTKGIIHHWIGAVFVPDHSAGDAVELLRNFEAYKNIYAGSTEDSKTLKRDGDKYRAYLRLRKERIVTVVLNSEYQAEFVRIDDRRWYSRSYSTRIAQVKDPGSAEERELPVGDDSGYLWRIATFWKFEETPGGVYLECEVIGLTRGIPYGFGWLVRPIIRSFPRESLTETLSDTKKALLGKAAQPRSPRAVTHANGLEGTAAPVKVFEAAAP